MSALNWLEILGWSKDQLDEFRFAGFLYLREGHYDRALIYFKTLILLDPTNAYDWETLGALYLQMGDPAQALENINAALALQPLHEPTLLNKVKTLIALKRKEEALALAYQLQKSSDLTIAGDASALITAYSGKVVNNVKH